MQAHISGMREKNTDSGYKKTFYKVYRRAVKGGLLLLSHR